MFRIAPWVIISITVILSLVIVSSKFFEVSYFPAILKGFRYLSIILLVMAASVIGIQVIATRHPHYEVWMIGLAGLLVGLLFFFNFP